MTSPQRKIDVTSKSPVGDISVVTLIRTDTTLDHSQKAEKVWLRIGVHDKVLNLGFALRQQQMLIHETWCWFFVEGFLARGLSFLIMCQDQTGETASSLGVGPRKNCEYALDDQTQQELE